MNTFQLFKNSLKKPTDLYSAKDLPFVKSFLYFLFLGLVLLIPVLAQTIEMLGTFQNDMSKIAAEMPEFSIQDNQLTTDEKDSSFLYKTNYMFFTFDPDGIQTAEGLQKDITGNKIAVGLLENELVLATTEGSLLSSLLETNKLVIPYKNLSDSKLISRNFFKELGTSTGNRLTVILLVVLSLMGPVLIDFAFSLFFGAFIAHLLSGARFLGLKLGQSVKILLFASTLPVFFCAIAGIFFQLPTSSIIMLVSIFYYFQIIRGELRTK
ncbi:DUF1189 family protein [Vagococcus elongatus]|uniref:DUF1189 domain-containing protein n=1 Tax=Vagococcus elongatus TaxID=180344 RepID=A0A430B2B8_9ENTE|nr:DUF1189 family protein [Vagococcus elongatus]RSU14372.1 hypothetical protein CBF29_03480 [Vagococcus elongatus]